jgi:hypothetical protein
LSRRVRQRWIGAARGRAGGPLLEQGPGSADELAPVASANGGATRTRARDTRAWLERALLVSALVAVAASVTRFDPPTYALGDSLPAIYPPGLILFFAPFGIASNTGLISDLHVHVLMVMTLAIAGVLASFQLRRTLRATYEPALAAVLTFFGAVLFVRWGLDGFVDPLASGLALLGIYWMGRNLPGRAVLALAVALSFQYRLWYLWPLVIVLAVRERRAIGVPRLVCVAVIGLASAFTFVLSFPWEANFHENPAIGPNALSVHHGISLEQGVALAAAVVVVGLVLYFDRWTAAACVALAFALIFRVDQWEPWYPVLLVPLLAVVRTRPAQVALAIVFLQALVYLGGFPNVLETARLYIDAVR